MRPPAPIVCRGFVRIGAAEKNTTQTIGRHIVNREAVLNGQVPTEVWQSIEPIHRVLKASPAFSWDIRKYSKIRRFLNFFGLFYALHVRRFIKWPGASPIPERPIVETPRFAGICVDIPISRYPHSTPAKRPHFICGLAATFAQQDYHSV